MNKSLMNPQRPHALVDLQSKQTGGLALGERLDLIETIVVELTTLTVNDRQQILRTVLAFFEDDLPLETK